MSKRNDFALIFGFAIGVLGFFSCTVGSADKERIDKAQHIVINELMANNRTGLLNEQNEPADWIEIKNTSNDSINLEGFELTIIRKKREKKAGKDNDNSNAGEKNGGSVNNGGDNDEETEDSSDEETLSWEFPDVTIAGGECLLIFADNGDSSDSETLLSADFKLPKAGATVQFKSPAGDVLSEVKYGKMSPDESYARQSDGKYKATYWRSPGFENNREGYEAAMIKEAGQRKSPLLIWEVMSRAKNSNENWVELKNTGDKEIDLSEYRLSKKLGKRKEGWALPSRKLQPGEFITLQLAGRKKNPYNSMQAPIKPGDSETIVLSKGGKFVDGVCAKMTTIGGSVGRAKGKKGFFYYSTPTRNAENGKDGRRFIAEMPEFDKKPGVYSKGDTLCIRLKDKTQRVHYTLDGRVPTSSSPVFGDSLLITRGMVVRTFAEGDSVNLRSNVATATYITGVEHTIPVMNISVNKSDLYDFNTGIYADGPGYGEEWPHKDANFWKDWTKNAHVELFDGDKGFSTDCGLRIFGGYSRNEEKKSFRLKFRGVYGNPKLDYDFFDEGESIELKDLVLRSGSQDYNRCMIRDEFFTGLLGSKSPTLLTQSYRPVALYINGEYFGLYYMRDKIDKNFVARKLDLPNDSINIIMSKGYNEEGPKTAYNELIKYVQTHDMTNKENYTYIKNLVDLQGLIDYKLGEMYSGNTDVGNIRYVRSTAPGSDRKWHFVFYDLDASWVGYKPSAEYYFSMGGSAADANVTHHNILINKLLANKEFRALFLERLSYHLTNTFSTENATAVFDELVERIRPEMKLNCERWPKLSYNQWEKNIEEFKKKFTDKPQVMLNDLRKYLNITEQENKKYFGNLGY